jgi:multidrug efflux pump subunit AcrB
LTVALFYTPLPTLAEDPKQLNTSWRMVKYSSESELYDYGLFRIRQQLSTVAGTLLPTPYGGMVRQIMVDLHQDALNANGLSPIDISNAISAQM